MAVYSPEYRSGKPYIIADEFRGVLPVSQLNSCIACLKANGLMAS